MSKLNELIKDLCPAGVKYEKIDDLVTIKRGKRVTKNDLIDDGNYKVISGGAEPMGYYNKFNREKNTITISSYGYAGYVNFITEDFWANDVCLCIFPKSNIDNKFLYYSLKNKQNYFFSKTTKAIPDHIPTEVIKETSIAVPPLEVQCEIVHILDDFTLLSAELSAELTARQKQYEYYRNKLLKNYDKVDKVLLKDVAEYSRERINASELNDLNYVGVDNLLQNKMGKTNSTHTPKTGNSTKYNKGDILIGNIRPYLKKIWFADIEGGTNGDVLAIHIKNDSIIPEYLYYILSSDCFFDYDNNNSKGAKMPRGNKEAVMNYEFYLPNIEEQKKIVKILDKFDKLTNDITSGIPAEIEKRQKQYEYYRDKLLSFKEVEVNE